MPWKNGLGVTFEIARVPDQENYLWRLSSAVVSSDCEFSVFPGYDRLLVVVSGEGLVLNGRVVGPREVFGFSGDEAMECRLSGGPVVDLGLIFDREKVSAEMVCFSDGFRLDGRAALACYVFDFESGDTFTGEDLAGCGVKRGVLVSVFGV